MVLGCLNVGLYFNSLSFNSCHGVCKVTITSINIIQLSLKAIDRFITTATRSQGWGSTRSSLRRAIDMEKFLLGRSDVSLIIKFCIILIFVFAAWAVLKVSILESAYKEISKEGTISSSRCSGTRAWAKRQYIRTPKVRPLVVLGFLEPNLAIDLKATWHQSTWRYFQIAWRVKPRVAGISEGCEVGSTLWQKKRLSKRKSQVRYP